MTAQLGTTLLAQLADPVRESSIQRWWHKAKGKPVSPWLSLLIGTDERSCGASVYFCYRPKDGGKTVLEPVVAVRWRELPQTQEDLVLLAQKALRALALERGWALAE